ncbi:MAG: GGDEF domain-containing protein [Oscillospiraceae bacterium]|nr:GGDEF domain-containing protein [Oscillospiraceae bacterium]
MFAVHFKKASVINDDIVNTVCFLVLGIATGEFLRYARLENIEMKRRAEIQKYTDFLTGLLNRRSFFECLSCNKHTSIDDKPAAIAMLDLDRFKSFNDTYGHQAGDECLHRIGSCLLNFQSRNAIKAFRYGGDESIIVGFSSCRDKFLNIVNEMRTAIETLEIPSSGSEHPIITVSIGVAFRDDDSENYEQLVSRADQALYAAKSNGRNRVVLFQNEMGAPFKASSVSLDKE